MFNFLRNKITDFADKRLEEKASETSERFRLSRDARLLFENYTNNTGAYASTATPEQREQASRSTKLEQAKQMYYRAVQLAEDESVQYDVAIGKYQLGMINLLQGDFDTAIAFFNEALEKFAEIVTSRDKVQRTAGDCHYHLGFAYLKNQVNLKKKDIELARKEFEATLDIDKAAGNIQSQMLSMSALSLCDSLLVDCKK